MNYLSILNFNNHTVEIFWWISHFMSHIISCVIIYYIQCWRASGQTLCNQSSCYISMHATAGMITAYEYFQLRSLSPSLYIHTDKWIHTIFAPVCQTGIATACHYMHMPCGFVVHVNSYLACPRSIDSAYYWGSCSLQGSVSPGLYMCISTRPDV